MLLPEGIVKPGSQANSQDVAKAVQNYPDPEEWQEAILRAKRYRADAGLGLVIKILSDHKQTGSWEIPRSARKPNDGTTRTHARRPASRETKYDPEELRRAREADQGATWEKPPDLL